MKKIHFLFFAILLFTFSSLKSAEIPKYAVQKITMLEINSSINPATLDYLETNFKKLHFENGDLIVIKLNTPGGLLSTTRDILTLMGSQNIPIVIWVTPEGASAASAGAIIASQAHMLLMSDGSTIGAATPVGFSDDTSQQDTKTKTINDLSALVTSLSKSRGRNAEKFSEMILYAKSFDAETALKENIINAIVNSDAELVNYLKNKTIKIQGQEIFLNVNDNHTIQTVTMDTGQKLLDMVSNPTFAYISLILGIALLYLEFHTPGGIVAGSIGALFLVISAIGFQVLPLNYGALGLIILSFILLIFEAYITSYGILTIAAIFSLVFGSLFLYRTNDVYLEIEYPIILATVAAFSIYVLFIAFLLFKTSKKKNTFFTKHEQIGYICNFIGRSGTDYVYHVKVGGEIWKTITKSELKINTKVIVINQDTTQMVVTIKEL